MPLMALHHLQHAGIPLCYHPQRRIIPSPCEVVVRYGEFLWRLHWWWVDGERMRMGFNDEKLKILSTKRLVMVFLLSRFILWYACRKMFGICSRHQKVGETFEIYEQNITTKKLVGTPKWMICKVALWFHFFFCIFIPVWGNDPIWRA